MGRRAGQFAQRRHGLHPLDLLPKVLQFDVLARRSGAWDSVRFDVAGVHVDDVWTGGWFESTAEPRC